MAKNKNRTQEQKFTTRMDTKIRMQDYISMNFEIYLKVYLTEHTNYN